MLTIASGPIVVLRPETWRVRLGLGVPEAELLRPLSAGLVSVEIVHRGRGEEPVLIYAACEGAR
jgi:hypothetical protein